MQEIDHYGSKSLTNVKHVYINLANPIISIHNDLTLYDTCSMEHQQQHCKAIHCS